jgi:subtilisin family serine protease
MIVPIKVLNDSGSGSYNWIASGIRYVADLKLPDGTKKIISMSLGGSQGSTELYDAVKYAIAKGVFIIAAAGNSYCNTDETIGFPGNYPEVITVASLDKSELVSDFSSCGANVDVIAPGSGIYSTHLNDSYAYLSGTSMATPQIAGIAALLTTTYDIKTQATLEVYLRKYAKDLAPKGFDKRNGYGAPIATRYTQSPGDNPPPPPIDTTPKPPTPPLTLKKRIINVPISQEYVILYGKASGGKYRFANIAGMIVEYSTTESVEDATARVNKAVKNFFTNRGFMFPDNQFDTDYAGSWATRFLEQYLKQNGLIVKVKEAWVSELLVNGGRNLVFYDKAFPNTGTTSQVERDIKAGRVKTFVYKQSDLKQ